MITVVVVVAVVTVFVVVVAIVSNVDNNSDDNNSDDASDDNGDDDRMHAAGFSEGSIFWDDEDDENQNSKPKNAANNIDGVFDEDTQIDYCCRYKSSCLPVSPFVCLFVCLSVINDPIAAGTDLSVCQSFCLSVNNDPISAGTNLCAVSYTHLTLPTTAEV